MSGVRLALPLGLDDISERHRAVHERTTRLKGSRQAGGARVLGIAEHCLPARWLDRTFRLLRSTRYINLVAANMAGPPEPLYLLGREVTTIFPCNCLSPRQRVTFNFMTYAGRATLTVAADASLPRLDLLRDALATEAGLLHALARRPVGVS
jgi:hypothetical protein